MFNRTLRFAALCAGVISLPACDDDGLDNHGCPTNYYGGWRLWSLKVEHTEPRQCPVFLSEPTVLTTGGRFVDQNDRNVDEVSLLVRNSSGEAKTEPKTVIFGQDSGGRWIAPIYTEYAAATGGHLAPDLALFDVSAGNTLMAQADMTITYTNAVSATISGIAPLAAYQRFTYSANHQQGVAPYTYRWYRDWELVGTGSSYTGYAPNASEMLLRLDVRDARGEADSHSRRIIINSCPDGQRTC